MAIIHKAKYVAHSTVEGFFSTRKVKPSYYQSPSPYYYICRGTLTTLIWNNCEVDISNAREIWLEVHNCPATTRIPLEVSVIQFPPRRFAPPEDMVQFFAGFNRVPIWPDIKYIGMVLEHFRKYPARYNTVQTNEAHLWGDQGSVACVYIDEVDSDLITISTAQFSFNLWYRESQKEHTDDRKRTSRLEKRNGTAGKRN